MSDDRISKLTQRFRQHAVGRPATSTRARERRTFYLDGELVGRIDQMYRELNHSLYPQRVNKSTFLEALLEYGLEHVDELKPRLSKTAETTGSGEEE